MQQLNAEITTAVRKINTLHQKRI